MTIRPSAKAKEGHTGTLTIFLFTPDEKQFSARIGFKIEKPEEQTTAGNQRRAQVQVPTPVAIHKDEWSRFEPARMHDLGAGLIVAKFSNGPGAGRN